MNLINSSIHNYCLLAHSLLSISSIGCRKQFALIFISYFYEYVKRLAKKNQVISASNQNSRSVTETNRHLHAFASSFGLVHVLRY